MTNATHLPNSRDLPLFQWSLDQWWNGVLQACEGRKALRIKYRSKAAKDGWRTRRGR